MRLDNIALLRSGLVLSRKQSKERTVYRYRLINLRSINSGGYIDIDLLETYYATEKLNRYYITQKGDIVIRLSSPYTAVLIDETTEGFVVSSNFVLLRAKNEMVLPEYRFWLLNTPNVRKDIIKHSAGNVIGAINAEYYNNFEITVLPLEKQRIVAEINYLTRRECQLLLDLSKEKEKYYMIMIDKIQKDMRRGKKYDN